MLRKLLHRLLRHRHFWREVGFDELSEMYLNSMFRNMTMNLLGIFAPLYLLKLGYSISDYLFVIVAYFAARAFLFDWLSGLFIARFGAKHTLVGGYSLLLASTTQFLTLPNVHWPLWLLGAIWGGSTSFYAIPFHVDFSKIKHPEHGGKELGYVNIMGKVGSVIGPLLGGMLAVFFGGQYIYLIAMLLLLVGGRSLLRTAEQVPTRQHLKFRGLPLRSIRRDIFASAAYGIELTLSGSLWPLYLAVIVLGDSTAYANLGFITSISVIASILTAYGIGRLVDAREGRRALRLGATATASLHLVRPLVFSFLPALLVNIADEASSICYQLPLIKGMYDRGDELDGHRIAYFTLLEGSTSFIKLCAWLLLFVLSFTLAPYGMLSIGFIIAAAASLAIMVERFPALD